MFRKNKYHKFQAYKPKSHSNKPRVNKFQIIIGLSVLAVVLLSVAVTFLAVSIYKNGQKIDKIEIVSFPDKTQYYIGEKSDYAGLKIKVILRNGTEYVIDESVCELSGFDSSVAQESQRITVSHDGYTTFYNIVINELPVTTPILMDIVLETLPTKTEYKLGESLSTSGGVIHCTYQNGSTFRISLMKRDVFGFDEAMQQGPGEYTLTVKYTENGITAETSYTITITE